MITIVTLYDGDSVDTFVALIQGIVTPTQRDDLRRNFNCDDYFEGDEDDMRNLFFCETEISTISELDLLNVDGEGAVNDSKPRR